MLYLILIFVSSILLFKIYDRKNSEYWKKKNVVQSHGAVLRDYVFKHISMSEIYKRIYEDNPEEPHVGLILGSKPTLLLRDPRNIQAVLTGDFHSFNNRGFPYIPSDVLANNIFFADGFGEWKLMRQKISPMFTGYKLKHMFNVIENCARNYFNKLKDNPGVVNNPFSTVSVYTTASIGSSAFGIDIQVENGNDSPFIHMGLGATAPSFKANFIFFIANMFPAIYKLMKLKAFDYYEEFFLNVMKNLLRNRKEMPLKRNDFIDVCLDIQSQILRDPLTGLQVKPTDELMASQAFFFFIAGSDSSAHTMHFTLLELSHNLQILEKLHKEIDEVFQSCDDSLTYEHLEKMQYLEMVINEAMRIYPPVGLLQRQCTKKTILPVGGVEIDEGVLVVVPIFGLQRDEKYYPDPEVFDPERFSAENIGNIKKFTYLPFGEGNRICLGARLARIQVKTGLAWLLRRFTLKPVSAAPKFLGRSFFSLRAVEARYELIPRKF